MKIKSKLLLVAVISVLIIFGFIEQTTINDKQFFLEPVKNPSAGGELKEEAKKEIVEESDPKVLSQPVENKRVETTNSSSSAVLLDVPFTSQAPFGEWSDKRQQDGCEETSVLMAVSWARGEKLSRASAKKEILAVAEYEKNKYDSFVDTNSKDTVKRIIKGYFNYEKAKAVENITINDIKIELYKGNLVLVPCNGRKLGNPNYTPPGPERHMLVIRGYDPVKKEFITNDAGTRKGEKYRYKEDVLYKAIEDYPTGDHEPIKEEKKSMIVVWR
jgi:hypothetical protein